MGDQGKSVLKRHLEAARVCSQDRSGCGLLKRNLQRVQGSVGRLESRACRGKPAGSGTPWPSCTRETMQRSELPFIANAAQSASCWVFPLLEGFGVFMQVLRGCLRNEGQAVRRLAPDGITSRALTWSIGSKGMSMDLMHPLAALETLKPTGMYC
jgi:hypothetical protein